MVDMEVRAAILEEVIKLRQMDAQIAEALLKKEEQLNNLTALVMSINTLIDSNANLLELRINLISKRLDTLEARQ